MKSFLKEENHKNPVDNVYNYLRESESATYYDELFSDMPERSDVPDLFEQVKEKTRAEGTAYKVMDEIVSFLEKQMDRNAIVIEIGGGRYQQRSANAYKRFANYFPLDISYSSIKKYTENFNKEGFVADATNLPFKSNSIDCIFTHTFLEHPLDPDKVLNEIARVLKPGGLVVHNDAWFCRWWHEYGIVGLKKFGSMSLKEKLISIAAAITEIPVLRIPPIIARRSVAHFLGGTKENLPLRYSKLTPNYNLHLGCDEDAASSIDPIDVVRFYESREFELVNKLSLKERLFFPNKYIVLRKIS